MISEHPEINLKTLEIIFPLKLGSIGPRKFYLGKKISKMALGNKVEAWTISATRYVQEAVNNLEQELIDQKLKFN